MQAVAAPDVKPGLTLERLGRAPLAAGDHRRLVDLFDDAAVVTAGVVGCLRQAVAIRVAVPLNPVRRIFAAPLQHLALIAVRTGNEEPSLVGVLVALGDPGQAFLRGRTAHHEAAVPKRLAAALG